MGLALVDGKSNDAFHKRAKELLELSKIIVYGMLHTTKCNLFLECSFFESLLFFRIVFINDNKLLWHINMF